jgi:AsmA protein
MRPWLRYSLYSLAALLLLVLVGAVWLVRSFDGERLKRVAADWMLAQHGRELAFDGPVTLQLWPQPAVTVQGARLSEPGRPDERFAAIGDAALSLRLEPLLRRREIEVDHVSAHGVQLKLQRGADGRSNIDDLLALAAGGDAARGAGRPFVIESLELADADLKVDDALGGVHGRLAIRQLRLGRFGPGLLSPLHLQAQAELHEPALNASLVLDAGLELLPAAQPGAPPALRLDKTGLRLQGSGYDFERLDARLHAALMRLEYGAGVGVGDSHVELDDLQLQFSGTRLGWQVDSGRLGLAQLRLDVAKRTLQLEQLSLTVQGRREATTLDLQFGWPALKVVGDALQGGPMSGRLQLGGDQQLRLQLKSQAPSGKFESISVPALQVEIDGRLGPSTLRGNGQATLLLAPAPLVAAIAPMVLELRVDDPALPPLQLALSGDAQLTQRAGNARIQGTINDQRLEARVEADLDRARSFVDVDASFATLDLNRFVAPANRNAAPAPAAASMAVNLQPLQWLDGRLQLKVARLLRPPYRIDALDLRARIDNGRLELQRVIGRAWGGRFDGSGSADANNDRLALRLRADDVDLRAVLADTTGYDGLGGRARLDANLQSRGRTVAAVRGALGGRIELSLQPAALRGVDLTQTLSAWRTLSEASSDMVVSDARRQTDFKQLAATFELRNGVAHSSDLEGESDFLRMAGEGTIDLAQGRLDYLLRARVVNTASGRAGPEMVFLNGVTVPVELHGPFGNIQWQVRWASVTAGVAARSVPNAVRGTVGGVTRGTTGVLRGAAGVLRSVPGAVVSPPPR